MHLTYFFAALVAFLTLNQTVLVNILISPEFFIIFVCVILAARELYYIKIFND